MGTKRLKAGQINQKLREAESDISRGQMVPQASKQVGVTEQAYYRWRKGYGGLRKNFREPTPKQYRCDARRCSSATGH